MRVMVFGVFDHLHDGHRAMLREAAAQGDVIAVVARDEAVLRLKGRACRENENSRVENVRKEKIAAEVVLGDKEEGAYEIIKTGKPDLIALGYDQDALEADLRAKMADKLIPDIPIRRLAPFRPEEMHSSLRP